MDQTPGIVVTGASGRMGQMLISLIREAPAMRLIGAIERSGHDWIGRDLGEAMGSQALGVTVSDDPQADPTPTPDPGTGVTPTPSATPAPTSK